MLPAVQGCVCCHPSARSAHLAGKDDVDVHKYYWRTAQCSAASASVTGMVSQPCMGHWTMHVLHHICSDLRTYLRRLLQVYAAGIENVVNAWGPAQRGPSR